MDLATAEELLCTEDFCFVCGRVTDHYGEHSDDQIRAAMAKRGMPTFYNEEAALEGTLVK